MSLLAVPNVSEGRDLAVLDAVGDAFTRSGGSVLLDRHADPDHHRAVFSLKGEPGALAEAVAGGVEEALARLDVNAHTGVHPRIGAVDVAPIVFARPEDRGAALAEALVLAELVGAGLGLPVYLYGVLAGGRTRAELRRHGSAAALMHAVAPDLGPHTPHPTGGAVLVAARSPLVAFNVVIGADLAAAKHIAAELRANLTGVTALGLHLPSQDVIQVSTNIEDPTTTAADVVAYIATRAPVRHAELVGLAPQSAFAGFPPGIEVRGLGPEKLIESALSGESARAS